MKGILFSFSLVLAVVLSAPSHSQTKYLAGNFWVENYTKKDGLPEDIIINITESSKGYMWMNTPYNLVRYDGYDFKSFSPRTQYPGIYTHFYPGLIEDSDGFLWMSSVTSGLFRFDPVRQVFKRFNLDSSFNGKGFVEVTAIVEDNHKGIWVGTNLGLNYLVKNGDSVKVTRYDQNLSPDFIFSLEKAISQNKPLVAISKPGDLEHKVVPFSVKQKERFFVSSMGESGVSIADYGWIENESGTRIWSQDEKSSYAAGGAMKNRVQFEVITLEPGNYKLVYTSDENHSWNKWNEPAPKWTELWGISLFRLNDKVLDELKIGLEKSRAQKLPVGNIIKALLKDSEGNIWVSSNLGLAKLVPGKNKQPLAETIVFPGTTAGSSMIETKDGKLNILGLYFDSVQKKTLNVFIVYDPKTRKHSFHLIMPGVLNYYGTNGLGLDDKGGIWCGSFSPGGDGLYYADKNQGIDSLKRLDLAPPAARKNKPSFDQVWAVYKDHSGNIWVGSRQYALYKIKPQKQGIEHTVLPVKEEDRSRLVVSRMKTDRDGNIWIYAKNNGVYKYTIAGKQVTKVSLPASGDDKIEFSNGKDSSFYAMSSKKFFAYQPDSKTFKALPVVVPEPLRPLGVDQDGNIWAKPFDDQENLAYYLWDGKAFRTLTGSQKLPSNSARSFHFGRNGNIWIAPSFEGIYQYKLDAATYQLKFVNHFLPEGVDVWDMYEDEQGILWAGSYDDGVIRLDPSKSEYKNVTRSDGLVSNFVYRVVPVGKKLWIVTDLGTAFLNKEDNKLEILKDLDEYLNYQSDDHFSTFTNGIGNADFAIPVPPASIMALARGGFFIFNPKGFERDSVKPVLQVERFIVEEKPREITTGKNLRFKYFENDIELSFIGIHFQRSADNQYAYFLKGLHSDWVNAGKERTVRFSNLAPGSYEFYLKAANSDGVWSDEKKMFSFTILPPWWQTWWAYILYTLLAIAGVWLFIRYRSRVLKKENLLLESKVEARTEQLNKSLEDLKATQKQLIQSEKMASLGELTAGIAHEIQNPLNFVNNFSEVNTELIDELDEQLATSNIEQAKKISESIRANEDKILVHGKRADAIVKSMLQHSRSGSGKKEAFDINALADEYLRLSYHGLRAKDSSFQAKFETSFDPAAGKVMIVPQEIGRVLLNLLNNAFYAVTERKKQSSEAFDPLVKLSTKRHNGKIEVAIADNGKGIPKEVADKIFQPFFTTKPTGQGTGLGLSLSYDIIKSHGGELKLISTEGQGAEFVFELPLNFS